MIIGTSADSPAAPSSHSILTVCSFMAWGEEMLEDTGWGWLTKGNSIHAAIQSYHAVWVRSSSEAAFGTPILWTVIPHPCSVNKSNKSIGSLV